MNRLSKDLPISTLYGVFGALAGVFVCALIGIDFSKVEESIAEVPIAASVQSQTTEK